MLDSLKLKLAAGVLGAALRSLATDKNTQTNFAGMAAAVVLAVPGFDVHKLITGDILQIAHVAAALVVWAIGVLTTRAGHEGTTSLLGVIAGALQGCSGQVNDVTTGCVIALLGYLTNKPVRSQSERGTAA